MNFQNIKQFVKENFSYLAISSFWLFTLMNPVFKKFDYGAEFPSVVAFAVIVFLCVLFEFKNNQFAKEKKKSNCSKFPQSTKIEAQIPFTT